MKHQFSLIPRAAEVSDENADQLYDAGCDDASILTRDGATALQVDREAPSLEEAIRSAVAEAESAGFEVVRVEIDRGEVSARAS